jgi:hypothetical protein
MRSHLDAFLDITAQWHLTDAERRTLLGSPADKRWFHLRRDTAPSSTPEEFARARAVLDIDQALSACVGDRGEAARWLHTLETAPPFFGRTPLAVLLHGMEGLKIIADYLATRRSAMLASASR